MRQNHAAAEKMFVACAGATVEVIDASFGEVLQAQVVLAVLGASSYTYAGATWRQTPQDWIGAHRRALVRARPSKRWRTGPHASPARPVRPSGSLMAQTAGSTTTLPRPRSTV